MASDHFKTLDAHLKELKRVYLDPGLASFSPSVEQQEMARAFLVFAHAELEWFVERICLDFSELILREASARRFSFSTLSLLTFASIEPLNGGESLGGRKGARLLSTRVGDAVAKHKMLVDGNEGLREKHLAKLWVPLGFSADDVDSAWLADLDSLCTFRGAFAHMSRAENRASHLSVNPTDIWQLCERIVWRSTTAGTRVSSFEDLDSWVGNAGSAFGVISISPSSESTWARFRRRIGLSG